MRSVLGRFLEHSRIYAFGTGDPPRPASGEDLAAGDEIWLGSPDMMHRNLDRRVESLVRVSDPAHCTKLRQLIALAWTTARPPGGSTATATGPGTRATKPGPRSTTCRRA